MCSACAAHATGWTDGTNGTKMQLWCGGELSTSFLRRYQGQILNATGIIGTATVMKWYMKCYKLLYMLYDIQMIHMKSQKLDDCSDLQCVEKWIPFWCCFWWTVSVENMWVQKRWKCLLHVCLVCSVSSSACCRWISWGLGSWQAPQTSLVGSPWASAPHGQCGRLEARRKMRETHWRCQTSPNFKVILTYCCILLYIVVIDG